MSVLNNFIVTYEDLNIVFNMLLGLIAGLLISGGYILANKNRKFSKNFVIVPLLNISDSIINVEVTK